MTDAEKLAAIAEVIAEPAASMRWPGWVRADHYARQLVRISKILRGASDG